MNAGKASESKARRGKRRMRALCAIAAVTLALGLLMALGAHIVPSHNAVSTQVERTSGSRLTPLGREAYAGRFEPTGDINVNAASALELTRITGVGEKLAAVIVAEREQNGRFACPEDLLAVRGIGESTLLKLLPQITLN